MAITATIFGATQATLESALGRAVTLAQLADWDGDGIADETVVQACLDAGASELLAFVEVKHEPEVIANLSAASLQRCKDANGAFAARIAWERGSQNQAMPEVLKEAIARHEQFARDLRDGSQRLGRAVNATAAALGQAVGVLDFDSTASGISIAGFKRGFR